MGTYHKIYADLETYRNLLRNGPHSGETPEEKLRTAFWLAGVVFGLKLAIDTTVVLQARYRRRRMRKFLTK